MIQRILGTSTQMLAQASEVVSQVTSEETTASLIRHLTAVVVFSLVGVLVLRTLLLPDLALRAVFGCEGD